MNNFFQIQLSKRDFLLKPVQARAIKEETIKAEMISQLTKQLGIQKDSWEQRLVYLAVQDEWLVQGGEKLTSALEWLAQSAMKKQDFQVIEYMSRTSLPFTKVIFQSLAALFSGKDLTMLLQSLTQTSNSQLESIHNLMTPLETKIGYRIAEQAFSPSAKHHEIAQQVLVQFMQSFAGTGNLDQADRKDLQAGITSSAALENIEYILKQAINLQSNAPILPLLGKYTLSISGNNWEQVFNQAQVQDDLFQLIRSVITAEIKAVITALGVNLEAELAGQSSEGLDSLKSTLLQLLKQDHVPQKQTLQELLSQLQGQKLVSSHEMGPIIQLITKLPLPLLNQVKDAEISWSGRKTEAGRIDASHCRILFHLHLEELGEIVLDLQVQNRISSLHVFHRFEKFVSPDEELVSAFKLGMKQLGYHVSSLQFQYVEEEEQFQLTPLSQVLQPQTKVDIQI